MLLSALALVQASASIPSARQVIDLPFERYWLKAAPGFVSDGVDHDEARQAFAWTILQHDLGKCNEVTKPDDTLYWRNWLRTERTLTHPSLTFLLKKGDQAFSEGKRETGASTPDADTCNIVIAALIVEVKR
jgi:hypothetical protein